MTTAFSILEEQPMDMLLGLDILKRHQCIIDLERNMLVIKSDNVETRFLSEAELPTYARPIHDQMEQESSPSHSTGLSSLPSVKPSSKFIIYNKRKFNVL